MFSKKSLIMSAAFLILGSTSAWATVTQCASTAGGSTISTYSASTNIANGCAEIDMSFSAFAVSGSGTGLPSTATTGNVNLSATGSSTAIAFNLLSNVWTLPSGNNTDVASSRINYVALSHQPGDTLGGQTWTPGVTPTGYTSPGAGNSWLINGVVVDFSAVTAGSKASGTLRYEFCVGASSTTQTGNCAINGGSQAGFIQITNDSGAFSYSCEAIGAVAAVAGCNSGGFSVSSTGVVNFVLASHVSAISAFNTVTLAHLGPGNSGAVSLSNFLVTYDLGADAPEPATFGFMAVGLAGIALATHRRRKRTNSDVQ